MFKKFGFKRLSDSMTAQKVGVLWCNSKKYSNNSTLVQNVGPAGQPVCIDLIKMSYIVGVGDVEYDDVELVHVGDGDRVDDDVTVLLGLLHCVRPVHLTFHLINNRKTRDQQPHNT